MKMNPRTLLFAILCTAAPLVAQTAAPAAAPAASDATAGADQDFAAFAAQRTAVGRAPGTMKEMGAANYYQAIDQARQKLSATAFAFYDKYPNDPRRWEAVLAASNAAPFFATSFGPDVEQRGVAAAVVDQEAKAAWEKKTDALKQALLASSDAPAATRETIEWSNFAKDFRATTAAKNSGQPFDYTPFHDRFLAHATKYAAVPAVPARARDYLGALESTMPGEGVKIWNELLQSPNETLRTTATTQLEAIAKKKAVADELAAKPLDLKFTSVDGREVDLQKLRGKVVLIDFWATWCGPCIAELPNVKSVYAAYHDKGFEIVGVALENGRLLPADTAEQTAAKLVAAKKVLTDFTTKEQMPWPQYFDGKYWKTDVSTRFDINSIPAMFLLDTEGKVVSTNARGPKLESEVKRLLKL
jgi:thiol-disulfide isomerase/thioredoxin